MDRVDPEGALGGSEGVGDPRPLSGDTPRFVAPTHGGVDILKLLTELEELVEHTKRGPMGTLFRFDEDRFHMIVMKVRANLPEEMKRASKLARDSERLVEQTRESAEKYAEDARRQAQAEMERASREAQRLRDEAQEASTRLRETADREARQIGDAARQTSDQTIAAANRSGEEIVDAARRHADELVAENEILRRAEADAEEMMHRSEAQAEEMRARAATDGELVRSGADEYARDVLTTLETALSKAVVQIQRGRETLEH